MSQVSKSAGEPGARRCSDAQLGSSPRSSAAVPAAPVRLASGTHQIVDIDVRRAIAAVNEAARVAYVLTEALNRVVFSIGSDEEAACNDAVAAGFLASQAGYLADLAAVLLGGIQERGGAEHWFLPPVASPESLGQRGAA